MTPGEGAFRATCSHTARRAGWKRAEGEHLPPPRTPVHTLLEGALWLRQISGNKQRLEPDYFQITD